MTKGINKFLSPARSKSIISDSPDYTSCLQSQEVARLGVCVSPQRQGSLFEHNSTGQTSGQQSAAFTAFLKTDTARRSIRICNIRKKEHSPLHTNGNKKREKKPCTAGPTDKETS